MIHLPTVAGGRVEHVLRLGARVRRGALLTRVYPEEGPIEEITAPIDGVLEVQRLNGKHAPRYAMIVGIRRVVLSEVSGRVRWIATLGPVGTTSMVALVETAEGAVRPHRAGGVGFVGERYAAPGQRVSPEDPLIEIRGEELG